MKDGFTCLHALNQCLLKAVNGRRPIVCMSFILLVDGACLKDHGGNRCFGIGVCVVERCQGHIVEEFACGDRVKNWEQYFRFEEDIAVAELLAIVMCLHYVVENKIAINALVLDRTAVISPLKNIASSKDIKNPCPKFHAALQLLTGDSTAIADIIVQDFCFVWV